MRSLNEHKLINESKKRIKPDAKAEPGKYSGLYYNTAEKLFKRERIKLHPSLINKMLQKAHDEGHLEYTAKYGRDAEEDIEAAIDKIGKDNVKMFAYESRVNESRFKSFHHVAILADDVFDIDLKGTDKEFTYTDADGNIIKVKVINPNKANVDGKMYNILDFAKLISGDDMSVLESKVNEAKKRYNNIKGLNREFGDGDEYDTGIQRYWRNERKGTFVYAYNSQIENPMAETPKHILVSGYEDYGDDTKNAFLVINKKKREIIDYDIWDYDKLLPIYFKNVKLKRTSAYESMVNEGKKYKIKELSNLWDEVYGELFPGEYWPELILPYKAGITKSEIAELWDKYYGEDIADEYSGFYDKLKESMVNESKHDKSPSALADFLNKESKHFSSFLKPKRFTASVSGDILKITPASGSFTITADFKKKSLTTTGKPEYPESVSYTEIMEYVKRRTGMKPVNKSN